jgi:hypothetical protein
MADLGEAFRQNVLNESLHKIGHRQSDALDLLGAVVPVAKGDVAILQAFQP